MKKRVEKSSKEKVDKVDCVTVEEPPKTADNYQCSGNLELDFTELCKLMGVKEIPSVKIKQSASTNRGAMEDNQFQPSLESQMTTWSSKPCLQIELENEYHGSVKEVKISGWKVDGVVLQVLNRILLSLINLQCLHMWRAGLTDSTFTSVRNTVSLCSNLRKVVLEGNPLPEPRYHLLIGEDSMLTDISLRNNHIGEEEARLIGSALSTVHSANKNLLSLNLAFNSIGDAGAIHLAKGLRLNQSLLCLSLAYNQIGDSGAAHLAEVYFYTPIKGIVYPKKKILSSLTNPRVIPNLYEFLCSAEDKGRNFRVLGPFALTHEETVERRKLLIKSEESMMVQPSLVSLADSHERPLSVRSSSSIDRLNKTTKNPTKKKENPKKDEKPGAGQAAKKEEPKVAKKDNKVPRNQAVKSTGKENNLLVSEQERVELVETVIHLLDPGIVHTGGKVIHPGNTCLTSLNLSGNKLTEQSLKVFLSSLESQGEGGLLRLSLNRNQFPSDCDTFLKIQEIMSLRDPLKKKRSGQMEDEHGEDHNDA